MPSPFDIPADLDTPPSVFLKLRQARPNCSLRCTAPWVESRNWAVMVAVSTPGGLVGIAGHELVRLIAQQSLPAGTHGAHCRAGNHGRTVHPLGGLQLHPASILTPQAPRVLADFLGVHGGRWTTQNDGVFA